MPCPYPLTSTHQRMLTVNTYNSLLMFSGFKRRVSLPTGQLEVLGCWWPWNQTMTEGVWWKKIPASSALSWEKSKVCSVLSSGAPGQNKCQLPEVVPRRITYPLSASFLPCLTASLHCKYFLASSPKNITSTWTLVSRSAPEQPKRKYLAWSSQPLTVTIWHLNLEIIETTFLLRWGHRFLKWLCVCPTDRIHLVGSREQWSKLTGEPVFITVSQTSWEIPYLKRRKCWDLPTWSKDFGQY